jgi:hypothetical protein
MAKQNINVGTKANDKAGDPLRTAFTKINDNFTELYTLTGGTSTALIELAQDYAAPLFNHASHTNITVTYDDANNKILLTGAAAQVQSNWTATTGLGVILNKPALFSGSYTDLTSKPTLFSGSYTDLTSKPTIPTSFSSLVNGAYTASLGSTGILTLSNGAIATTVDNNATVNTSATVTTNNSYTNTTDFSTDVDLGGGIGVIAGWYQRNSEQIEFALFGPSAFQTYLTGLALGRTVIVTYSTSGGNQTLTRTLTQAFTATGQVDPANPTWGRVSGRIDATLPAGQTGIVSINFPVYSTSSKTWTFGTNGNTTFPTGLTLGAPRGVGTVNFTCSVDKEFQIETGTASAGRLWQFGTAGNTTFPSGLTLHRLSTPYSNITADLDKILQIATQTSGGRKEWTFGTDGVLTVPHSIFGNGTSLALSTGATAPGAAVAINTSEVNINFSDARGGFKFTNLGGATGSITFPDASVQTTAYVAPTTGNSVIDSINPLTISQNGMTIRVTSTGMIQMSFNSVIYITGRSSINNADSAVISSPNGVTTASTWYNIGAVLAAGDHLTATIVDASFHRIYRLTAIIREKGTTPGSEFATAYAIIEQIQ